MDNIYQGENQICQGSTPLCVSDRDEDKYLKIDGEGKKEGGEVRGTTPYLH